VGFLEFMIRLKMNAIANREYKQRQRMHREEQDEYQIDKNDYLPKNIKPKDKSNIFDYPIKSLGEIQEEQRKSREELNKNLEKLMEKNSKNIFGDSFQKSLDFQEEQRKWKEEMAEREREDREEEKRKFNELKERYGGTFSDMEIRCLARETPESQKKITSEYWSGKAVCIGPFLKIPPPRPSQPLNIPLPIWGERESRFYDIVHKAKTGRIRMPWGGTYDFKNKKYSD